MNIRLSPKINRKSTTADLEHCVSLIQSNEKQCRTQRGILISVTSYMYHYCILNHLVEGRQFHYHLSSSESCNHGFVLFEANDKSIFPWDKFKSRKTCLINNGNWIFIFASDKYRYQSHQQKYWFYQSMMAPLNIGDLCKNMTLKERKSDNQSSHQSVT